MTYQDPRYRDPEYGTKWRKAHPERTKAYSRRYLEDPKHREENRARASRNYYANQAARQAQQRAYYHATKGRLNVVKTAHKYGLTVEAYRDLLARHEGKCGICGVSAQWLAVDHDHMTGVVRGLLCVTCNFMIGHGKDDPALLRKAADYLEGVRDGR